MVEAPTPMAPSDPSAAEPVHAADHVRVAQPRRAAPADAVRPTRAEVNLGHLRHNLRVLERALANPSSPAPTAKLWGVLKADAYGHGAPAVARTLERAGMPGLCVALLEEAMELRAAGIALPILVMGGYYGARLEGLAELVEGGFVPVVYDAGQVERIASFVRLQGGPPLGVHLKVDTGMGRLGAPRGELARVLEAFAEHPEVRLAGMMTHFACADTGEPAITFGQLRRFQTALERAAALGLTPEVCHAANSAAMLRIPESRLDVVRPGLALYGVTPLDPDAAARIRELEEAGPGGTSVGELRPVMRVRTEIVALRTIEAGESIGYGHTWQAERASLVATVPLGYADGLARQLSNRGAGLVRGRRAPIAGTVSMDLTMLDVTDIPGVRLGDEVVVLGAQEGPLGRDTITATEIAGLTGTIPWEVLTSISRRVPRFYREP